MSTIKEVAKECGVSIATVSNILNGKGRVGNETRERILKTAREMGYVPNMVARNLRQRNTRTIGVITEDLTVFNCAEIVDGINEYLEERNYTFLLGNLRLFKKYDNEFYHHEEYQQQVKEEFMLMQSKKVDGIIYVGAHCHEIRSIPGEISVPLVVAYGFAGDRNIPSVIFDDERGAYEATCELIRNGHRRIGVICGEKESLHTAGRILGYQKALYDNEILYNPNLSVEGNWSRTQGYAGCGKLLGQDVTAIFAMSDVMAAGVYDYAHAHELEIGKDLALIGFDNRQISEAFRPALTTMALPLHAIGSKAAEVLIHMIEKEESGSNSLKQVWEQDSCEGELENNTWKIKCAIKKRGSINETINL
ncbi:MAG: LacI family DNA-binding transcriptional regulator [Lachnospiraceae bacterium]|nr:LacI family DNA-binding transcriptional regulator [Lachnospiraceae bacterium]